MTTGVVIITSYLDHSSLIFANVCLFSSALIVSILSLLFVTSLFAQAPQSINYQAAARTSTGELLTDQEPYPLLSFITLQPYVRICRFVSHVVLFVC